MTTAVSTWRCRWCGTDHRADGTKWACMARREAQLCEPDPENWADQDDEALSAIRMLLSVAGDDPMREGLRETPQRVLRAYKEWFSGYDEDPKQFFKSFKDGAERYDELVMVANIGVFSHCEHHCAPFWGLAHVAYIPNGYVLGLSKFSRLVEIFARRLQVQERLTSQIADCIHVNLSARAVGVVLECRHMCLESRGVRQRGTITTTSVLRGALQHDIAMRAEFFALVQSASKAKEGV